MRNIQTFLDVETAVKEGKREVTMPDGQVGVIGSYSSVPSCCVEWKIGKPTIGRKVYYFSREGRFERVSERGVKDFRDPDCALSLIPYRKGIWGRGENGEVIEEYKERRQTA